MKESDRRPAIDMERVCKSSSSTNDLLGEWFSPNYPGAMPVFPVATPLQFPTFVEFTTDRKLFFRSTPLKSTQGQYEFSNGVLIVRFPGEPPLKSKPHITSDQTDMRVSQKGPEIPFRRVTGSNCASQS